MLFRSHEPFSIGTAWTGVYVHEIRQSRIVEALKRGNCFASEAPFVRFDGNEQPMGSVLEVAAGDKVFFRLKAADAAGIRCLNLIEDGGIVQSFHLNGELTFDDSYMVMAGKNPAYYRLEVIADDDRRAFSAPIYTVSPGVAAPVGK